MFTLPYLSTRVVLNYTLQKGTRLYDRLPKGDYPTTELRRLFWYDAPPNLLPSQYQEGILHNIKRLIQDGDGIDIAPMSQAISQYAQDHGWGIDIEESIVYKAHCLISDPKHRAMIKIMDGPVHFDHYASRRLPLLWLQELQVPLQTLQRHALHDVARHPESFSEVHPLLQRLYQEHKKSSLSTMLEEKFSHYQWEYHAPHLAYAWFLFMDSLPHLDEKYGRCVRQAYIEQHAKTIRGLDARYVKEALHWIVEDRESACYFTNLESTQADHFYTVNIDASQLKRMVDTGMLNWERIWESKRWSKFRSQQSTLDFLITAIPNASSNGVHIALLAWGHVWERMESKDIKKLLEKWVYPPSATTPQRRMVNLHMSELKHTFQTLARVMPLPPMLQALPDLEYDTEENMAFEWLSKAMDLWIPEEWSEKWRAFSFLEDKTLDGLFRSWIAVSENPSQLPFEAGVDYSSGISTLFDPA
jgi:hypothetical protein